MGGGDLRNHRHMRKIHSTTSYVIPNDPSSGIHSEQGSEIDENEEFSDTETLPYDMDDQEFPLTDEEMLDNCEQKSEENTQMLNSASAVQNTTTTRSGRSVKPKRPTDYNNL